MTIMGLINLALITALIIFSVWCFRLRFEANRVCTIKDLLLAFVTGGALAVTTLVFGVTGEIMDISNSIKEDTGTIRTAVGDEKPDGPVRGGETTDMVFNNDLEGLYMLARQNAETLQQLVEGTIGINNKLDRTNEGLERVYDRFGGILKDSALNQFLEAQLSGPQLYIEVGLLCSISKAIEGPSCIIVPNER